MLKKEKELSEQNRFCGWTLKQWGMYFLLILTTMSVIQNFFFTVSSTEGPSMQPTFYTGDIVIVSRVAYWFNEPEQGDIVMAIDKDGTSVVKRIARVPGDATYLSKTGKSLTIPNGRYYLLGDNAKESYDSRYYGCLPREQIFGKVVYTFKVSKER